MSTINPAPWLLEKTGRVVTDLSRTLTSDLDPKVREHILEALYNAIKLYVYAVELDTGAEIGGLHCGLHQYIKEHPEDTVELLQLTHERAKQPPNTRAAFEAQQNSPTNGQ